MNANMPDRGDDGFDDFASAAGAALRRPAPDGGLAGVRQSRQRHRAVQIAAGTGAAVLLFVGGALVLGATQDDSQRLVTPDTTLSTTPDNTPSTNPDSSTSTSTTTTTTVVERSGGPVTLTAATPMLWADGVLVAAWVNGEFVGADQTEGVPPEILDTPIEMIDRTGTPSTWTPEIDVCGITRLRSAGNNQFFGQGYLWSSNSPTSGTLDGASQSDSAELDDALSELGLDPGSLDRLVPSADLDGDPDEEVVIVRYDPDTAPTDTRSAVWLAVWDPGTVAITTLVGDATSNDTHFTAFGDGIADLDANGLYDTAVDTGDSVTLIELATGTILSTVDTSCPNPVGGEIVLRPDGIGSHAFGESQSVVEAALTAALGTPEVVEPQSAPVSTCWRWGCSASTVLQWPDAGLLVAFSDRTADGDALPSPVLAAWTLTPTTSWLPGDIYTPDPNSTGVAIPPVRLALANGIGLGSTAAELGSALPSTVTGWWNESSFVPTGFYVPDSDAVETLDGDLDWDVVAELQSALVADGASLAVDGIAGPDTTAAFTAYRERTGLLDDARAAFEALGITGPPPDAQVVRLSAGDWAWELSCGGLEPFGIPSGC